MAPTPTSTALVPALRAALAWEEDEPAPVASWGHTAGLVDAARAHRVVPVLAPWRDRLGLEPADAAALDEAQRANAARALASARELTGVVTDLGAAGVRSLVLKGLPLALRTTGNLAGRHCGDLDLFVATADLGAADRALRDRGYVAVAGPAGSPLTGPNRRWVLATDNHAVYGRGPDHVEVHWQLTKHGLLPIAFDDAWAARAAVELGGTEVAVLGDEHELLFVTVHGAKHHFSRLQWLVDVVRLLQRTTTPTWEATVARATELRLAVALEASSIVAGRLAPRPLPRVDGLPARQRRQAVRLADAMWATALGGESSGERLGQALRLRADGRYRGRVLVGALAPADLLDTAPGPPALAPLLLPFRKLPLRRPARTR